MSKRLTEIKQWYIRNIISDAFPAGKFFLPVFRKQIPLYGIKA